MASYTISESVIGIPLFVPDAHNFFSIEAAGMPNGDPCLVVHGDVNRDYKAFMNAPALSPDIFRETKVYNAAAAPVSLVFWIKMASYTGLVSPSAHRPDQTLISCSNGLWAPTNDISTVDSGNSVFNIEATNDGIQFINPIPNATTDDYVGKKTTALGTTWRMITVVKWETAGNAISLYLDDEVTATSTTVVEGSTTSSPKTMTDAKLCIGAYSDNGSCNGAPVEWRVGKISAHAEALNATQRALLYNAMTA